ncbi:chromosome segregation protein SMC [Streptococcus sp. DD13]|uniref:chromosome segregation protein SMC n=1 Tax=Streptococcus sp. DD13 TaxID=1777881 RepID=UPI000799B7D6|nr:chromosome segregation protein SMC [Streptococcus sp. DD13]KXT79219.1 Chromosome partition protein smc [Streptococcus sp. DD13]
MYLKSIEMQGFKSFADKTKVVFDRGVTAVVGPNGSGKSNITESLRWALGESSAKSLRGGKMPDVIFAGTESRRALNYASVIVTLDNHNHFIPDKGEEIRVERHIYRSGDSEYKIDGQKVRLRDIHDLFMDTGLGRDSFSIISQGRVEEIFNSKPEERRAIFEEAAGVLKYKTRKKETETKLSQTQDNLDRLEDIVYELERQVTPLEKQAQTAKQFLALEEERKSLHLNVLVAQIQQGREELEKEQAQLHHVKDDLKAYYRQREQLEQDYQQQKSRRQSIAQQLTEKQDSLVDITKFISDVEGKIQLRKLESTQNQSSKESAQDRLGLVEQRLSELKEQMSTLSTGLEEKQVVLDQLRQTKEQVRSDIADFSEDPDTVIERLRDAYVRLMEQEAEQTNHMTRLSQELSQQEALAVHRSQKLQELQEEVAASATQVEESQAEYQQVEQALKALLQQYKQQENELLQAKQQYQEQQEAVFDLLDQLKSKRARQSSLEAIQKSHSNFYAGVKAVLQEGARIGGVIGAVSEHVTFETDYQTAIEIALGGASQHIIVEDEQAARQAISYLKQGKKGRATFLPLTTVKPRSVSSQILHTFQSSPGFIGIASELVSYDGRLANIFENLLGGVVVFATLEEATQAARATRFQTRIVTLDGSEIRPGGSFAGGSNRNSNTLFIKPELATLEQEVKQLNDLLRVQEEALSLHQTKIDQLQESLGSLQTQGEDARLREQRTRLEKEQIEERHQELNRLLEATRTEASHAEVAHLKEELERYQETLNSLQEEKDGLEQQIEELRGNREFLQTRLRDLQTQLSSLQVQESEAKSQIRFDQTNLETCQAQYRDLSEEKEGLKILIAQKELAMDDRSIESLTVQQAQAQERKEEVHQALIRLRFESEDIEGQIEDIEGHLEQARLKNEELIRSQTKLEALVEQISNQLRKLLLDLTEQYKLSFEAAQQEATSVEDLQQAESQLKTIEGSIRALGPVNLDAIEQYEEVHQRLNFLTSQREDVLRARDMLLETIHEMDDEVKERFQLTFTAIRESFQNTFKQMFGGGSADLILTSSDLLTTGVEISVQPPGKKIQSLNLMSGGEKALSALALLFSIIRVKTIPFVILDEVEAALDEANVKRFGDYLNRFDQSSQFIVVTHRKGTMAAADAIYGVTMQESGVSKIVSVKLKDLEDME